MSIQADTLWTDVLSYVRRQHPAISRGWFPQLQPGSIEQGRYQIFAPDPAQVVYLNRHCARAFTEAVQAATGRLISVDFLTSNAAADRSISRQEFDDDAPSFERDSSVLRLIPDYTFESFVTGPCNRFAHAAALAATESPGTAYNPLFIHGACGLGKTHLLQAMCHRILDRSPATRIMYVSCETFVNQFIEAVERSALHSFRNLYRRVDMLVLDDMQFLAGRDGTQEEFFHTFNALHQVNKQIVLSADLPPQQIPSLEERLVSRFKCGLLARIDAPCLETRGAIIRKKLRLRQLQLPEDAIMHIAEFGPSNTRELEGALNRIHGLSALEGRPIDLPLVREALGGEPQTPTREVKIQDIIHLVTDRFGVKLSDLQGRKRSRSIALPRQVCMFLARQFTRHSLEEIGGFFGGRDHTTVLHANKLVAGRRRSDAALRARLDEIESVLLKGT